MLEISTDTMQIQGSFGTWQVTTGGGPDILIFNMPLNVIIGKVSKNGEIITQFDYQKLTARVELTLKFIDTGAGGQNLVVDAKNPPTSVMSLLDSSGRPLSNELDDAYIKEALTDWFAANLSDFNHCFASLDLDPSVDGNMQWAFCKPAVVAYTYVSGDTLSNSYLGLLYNTSGNATPGTVAQIDPSFIPPGCEAAFMLSPAMFLSNFLAPSTAAQFGIPQGWLSIDTNGMSISLAGGVQVNLPQVTGSDSDQYQPVMNSMEVVVEGSIMTMYASTATVVLDKWYGTVTAYDSSQSWMTLALDQSSQGLAYVNTQPSISNHTIEKSEGFEILQDILEAIGIITLVVATILTDGAALLFVGALAGLAQGGVQWGLAWFEDNHQNDAPEITTLVSNLNLPVTWTGAGPFETTQAGLCQGAFFLAGELRPGSPNLKDLRSRIQRPGKSNNKSSQHYIMQPVTRAHPRLVREHEDDHHVKAHGRKP